MTILFATDLSAQASRAGDVAARLARSLHERLVVLHVAEPADDVDRLEHEVARLEQTTPAELAVGIGAVVPAIASYAIDHQPRYVVVGAQGESARALLGTVATSLAARLPMALFVVRAADRLLPFFDRKAALKVVLPHALDETFVGARDALIELSRIAPIDAVVLHAPVVHDQLNLHAREALRAQLAASVGRLPGVDVRVVIREGVNDSVDRIIDEIRERQPDLVLCGTHQRRGVERVLEGSYASFLAREAPCTVLVAPLVKENAR